jgi:hypothetical protein
MGLVIDSIKRALLDLNRFQVTLERLNLVSYDERIKWSLQKYKQRILFEQEGNEHIGYLISQNKPSMVSRLGLVEMWCLLVYLERMGGKKKRYSDKIRNSMTNNAGFFPVDDKSIDDFAEMYLDSLKQADVMGVWFYKFEDFFCNVFCRNAELVENGCLEPFRFTNPWSGRLAGKKVLVIHPFAESIQRQYANKRQLLFADPDVLPEFELKTVKAVQSIAGSKVHFATWFDAYRHMCDEMARVDFDICLIGAGAYGLPLASFAKNLGKQAIHMGGVTQILFGIKGRRWELEHADTTAKLFNEHWTRPLASETPGNKNKVEKGCYW